LALNALGHGCGTVDAVDVVAGDHIAQVGGGIHNEAGVAAVAGGSSTGAE